MMGFTADGQANAEMVAARDKLRHQQREQEEGWESIPAPALADGADAWQKGKTIQLAESAVSTHNHTQGAQASRVPAVGTPER